MTRQQRPAGSAQRVRALCSQQHRAVGESPGAVPLRHHFVQSAGGNFAQPGGAGDRAGRAGNRAAARPFTEAFQGTAQAYQDALSSEPILIAAALITVYIVLGVLYESLIHRITILSTLPSAGVGALLALMVTHNELNVVSLIGIILLIGIVKKNAIMMIDFAIAAERNEGLNPEQAIFKACVLRFRPITMTTMAALLGGLPLALGHGEGAEMRRPLGMAIVGGLVFSQAADAVHDSGGLSVSGSDAAALGSFTRAANATGYSADFGSIKRNLMVAFNSGPG